MNCFFATSDFFLEISFKSDHPTRSLFSRQNLTRRNSRHEFFSDSDLRKRNKFGIFEEFLRFWVTLVGNVRVCLT